MPRQTVSTFASIKNIGVLRTKQSNLKKKKAFYLTHRQQPLFPSLVPLPAQPSPTVLSQPHA